ncbi:asparagine synthetase B [Paenibacillus lycopersici]|uniref:asparagine synthase (glutamine-hydrolyzing) n=1 Tax=Paenibacillus lycopersici TaxID=2704462 RepID=A0A6C0FV71_9BACL|nr:asparagine synthase-related protein [Paenibacillus lycopersici]QHT59932.1 asparagine synthetase B [Paenibacillus lycopersici]
MSLIAGIVNDRDSSPNDLRENGLLLMQAMRDYPADDARHWHDESAFLGCHAQWITPQSVYEKLPCYNESLDLAITADAILDNRDALCNRFQIESSRRDALTDSELIVMAYERWGTEAPKYLIGDYAFMIWDRKQKRLFGARDLAGNRTLYYHYDRRSLTFCTAIAPLLALPSIKQGLNESWLSAFLAINAPIDSVDVFATAYRNILQIPPGHSLISANGRLTLSKYDSLVVSDQKLSLPSDGDYEEAFREVFGQAVASRLRTFKQVGATLSGGLDSGSVVSFAASALRNEGKTLHTYSHVPAADFQDWTARHLMADERPFIQETIRHVGNIQDNYLDSQGQSPFTEIDEWLNIMESPYKFFANSFWIRDIYRTARQQGMGVLLTGARGNSSISWGSVTQYCAHLLKTMRWIQFYRQATLFSRQMRIRRSQLLPNIGKYAFPFVNKLSFAEAGDKEDFPQLINPDFAARTQIYNTLKDHQQLLTESPRNITDERQFFFNNLAILNMQGTSGAKLSLKYGIWERDPTCDPRVVRFCLSLPIEQFVLNGVSRSLIRRATDQYLPDKVRWNQRVKGFQSADWVHRMTPVRSAFIQELHDLCNDSAASEYLNIPQIRSSLTEIERQPFQPELAMNSNMIYLMRSLVVYRFLRKF